MRDFFAGYSLADIRRHHRHAVRDNRFGAIEGTLLAMDRHHVHARELETMLDEIKTFLPISRESWNAFAWRKIDRLTTEGIYDRVYNVTRFAMNDSKHVLIFYPAWKEVYGKKKK